MKKRAEVLLVDDNPADLDLTRDLLASTGQQRTINTVIDGEEAIDFLRRNGKYISARSPDLIILDLNLPRKNGWQVLEEVKSDPKLRATPVVIFSTSEANHDIGGCYRLGANSYVRKPGNLQEFMSVIRSIGQFWFESATLPDKEAL
ncbi:MAG TPA: response regulator [Terriglobales bacterium]|jgi:CheY-like chemotaxis protein